MAKLGRTSYNSKLSLKRTALCSIEPSIIDNLTLEEIQTLFLENLLEIAGDVGYKKFNPATSVNSVYKESTQKQFFDMVILKGIINVNPSVKEITALGIRELVDVIVKFSTKYLQDLNINITTNDRLVINNQEYNVYQVNPEDFVHNHPVTTIVSGKIWSIQAPKKSV